RHHYPQAPADVAEQVITKQANVRTQSRVIHHLCAHSVGGRKFAKLDANHSRDVTIGFLNRDAGSKARHRLELVTREPHGAAVKSDRHDEIVRHIHEPEVLWQYANNLAGGAIGQYPSADDVWVTPIPALPIAMTEHDHIGTFRLAVLLYKAAAKNGIDSQQR